MKTVHVMIKPASSLCNLICGYCFYRDEANRRDVASYGVMSVETMRGIVKRVCAEVTCEANFIFQGGEPLLAGLPFFEAFERAVQEFAPKGLSVSRSVQTNATLIDDSWADFFARHGYLVGVSLDGPAGRGGLRLYAQKQLGLHAVHTLHSPAGRRKRPADT